MFLIKTLIKSSKIHGTGVFTEEFIPKGALVWQYNDVIDKKISVNEIANLPEIAKQLLETYAWREGNEIILCGDNGRFVNHNVDGNLGNDGLDKSVCIALKDINIGEELTENYSQFDEDFDTYKDTLI